MNLTQEQKFKFRLRLEQEQAQTKMSAPEGPGLVGRSVNTAKQAVGEAVSNLYTGVGNPYNEGKETDIPVVGPAIDWASRSLEGGGKIGGAVADVIGDVAGTAYEAIGSPFKEEGTAAINSVMGSAPVQAAGQAMNKVSQEFPGATKAMGDAMAVGSMLSPTKAPRIDLKLGREMAKREATRALGTRRDAVKWLLEPDKPDWNQFEVLKGRGPTKTVWKPTKFEQEVIDTVNAVKGVNPRASFGENYLAVKAANKELAMDVAAKIAKHGEPIPVTSVYRAVDGAIQKLESSPVLVGNAETSALRIYKTFKDEIQAAAKANNGTISPEQLFQIRKNLDQQLGTFAKGAPKEAKNAMDVAGKEIRDRLNDLVEEFTPGIEVKKSMEKQFKYYQAENLLNVRHKAEANGAVRQFIEGFERASGLKHPTTPAAMTMTATHLPTAAMTLLGAVVYGTGAKVKDKTLAALRAAVQSPEYALKATEKASIIALINEYREMSQEEDE